MERLTPPERALLEYLRSRGGEVRATVDQMSARIGYSRAWTYVARRQLIARGLLADVPRTGPALWRIRDGARA